MRLLRPTFTVFQSTSSVWRTTGQGRANHRQRTISIHVLRVEDDRVTSDRHTTLAISIHVLRVEDDRVTSDRHTTLAISIHVLRVEDDTGGTIRTTWPLQNFNPRPPCGGRRRPNCRPSRKKHFNPRPPCGGRLPYSELITGKEVISIHVLRVEDDKGCAEARVRGAHFNPRPPCGGRLGWAWV